MIKPDLGKMLMLIILMVTSTSGINSQQQPIFRDSVFHERLQHDFRRYINDEGTLDSVISFRWNPILNDWINDQRDVYKRDINGHLVLWTISQWAGNRWEPTHLNSYENDAEGNPAQIIYQEWNGTAWENHFRLENTFNDLNKLLISSGDEWNGSSWIDDSETTLTYDSNHNLVSIVDQRWNGGLLENLRRRSFMYLPNHQEESNLSEIWVDTGWIKRYLVKNEYTETGNIKMYSSQEWIENAWTNYLRIFYTYNASDELTREVQQRYSNNQWNNYTQHIYKRDVSGHLYDQLTQDYENGEWVNQYHYINTIDSYGHLISFAHQNWKNEAWVNSDSLHCYYSTMTPVEQDITGISPFIYPNPVMDQLQLQFDRHSGEKLFVQIISQSGHPLKNMWVGEREAIPVGELTSGVYFILAGDGKSVITTRFIKL